MLDPAHYRWLADLVLLLHFAVVIFVVSAPAAVLLGQRLRWTWVDRLGFRLTHLAAIGFVVLQAWLGAVCPLTRLENWLRLQARDAPAYAGSFIEAWVGRILFYEAPGWVFAAVYSLFLLVVLAIWIAYPPRRRGRPLAGG